MMNSFLDKAVVPINTIPEQKAMNMNTGGALSKDDMLSTPPPMFMNFGGETMTTKPQVNVNVPQIIQANSGVMSLPFNVQRPISAGLSDIKFMNMGGSADNTGLMGLMSNTKYDI